MFYVLANLDGVIHWFVLLNSSSDFFRRVSFSSWKRDCILFRDHGVKRYVITFIILEINITQWTILLL